MLHFLKFTKFPRFAGLAIVAPLLVSLALSCVVFAATQSKPLASPKASQQTSQRFATSPDAEGGANAPVLSDDPYILPSILKVEGGVQWRTLEKGLDVAEFTLMVSSGEPPVIAIRPLLKGASSDLVALRIDPAYFDFVLHMETAGKKLSMQEFAREEGLIAAINAGMFMQDNLTNTGYMRFGEQINNGHVASNFGAFFLAAPKKTGLPNARLVEKSALGSNIMQELSNYQLALQNYRLISSERKVLWPQGSAKHSISVLSCDPAGNIMLIMCRAQLSPVDFARILLRLPFGCQLTMYLEGGHQAGLFLANSGSESNKTETLWRGKYAARISANPSAAFILPNMIGVKRR